MTSEIKMWGIEIEEVVEETRCVRALDVRNMPYWCTPYNLIISKHISTKIDEWQ